MKLAAALLTRPVSGPTAQIASTMASTWAASRISQICQCTFPEPSAAIAAAAASSALRSEEHTSELQSLMRISYAVFCLKKKKKEINNNTNDSKKHTLTRR